MAINTDLYRPMLGISSEHTLELADTRKSSLHWSQRESLLLKEFDTNSKLIAHYRVWDQQSNKAPYRRQRGWEKYSLDGDLLDREVRYSRRDEPVSYH